MAEENSLDNFDFDQVTAGKFLKFEAGKPVTIRVLTKDPVLSEADFSGDITTRLNFIVWNFTINKAQILSCTWNMGKTFQRIGKDEDFGEDLQKCDIKISPEGEKLKRVYDIQVIRHSGNEKPLTADMLKELKALDLLKEVKDHRGRLSEWKPPKLSEDEPPIESTEEPEDMGEIDLSEVPF